MSVTENSKTNFKATLHSMLAGFVFWSANGHGWKVWVRAEKIECIAYVRNNHTAHRLKDGLVAGGTAEENIHITRGNVTAITVEGE